tara:strand:- start:1041 stop:2291 length:1251 start_codon:yes stop_codon:yes gene_type:complete
MLRQFNKIIQKHSRNMTSITSNFIGAVDLANGRTLLDEHKLQEACAATPVASSAEVEMYKNAICTHSGSFHCDEALAIGLLKLMPRWKDSPVIRTRKSDIIDACKIVVDVGGTHDHSKSRYDHHQREFNAEFEDITLGKETGFKTKLSSAGLVYKYYGKEILNEVRLACGAPEEDAALADKIWKKIYQSFIEHVDGIDNGIEAFEGGVKNYNVSSTLSGRVGSLNPSWNEPSSDDVRNQLFQKAMLLTQKEFLQKVTSLYTSWFPARSIVEKALSKDEMSSEQKSSKRQKTDGTESETVVWSTDEQIFVLDQYCPWIEHLFDLEQEKKMVGRFKYCLFPDSHGGARIRAVPAAPGSFASRKALPTPWRALRDEELSTLTGIEGCVFVHNSGFIGGNKSFDGAMLMARAAVEFEEKE